MRVQNYFLLIPFFAVAAAFAALSTPVSALSEAQKSAIAANCGSIKQTLRSVQHADSRTRVYLGSVYQTSLTNYITPLNLRLVKNNQADAILASLQTDFTLARDDSAKKFITYSQSLEELILIDCEKDPEKFYNALINTRKKRAELSASAAEVAKILNEHIKSVTELKDISAQGDSDAR